MRARPRSAGVDVVLHRGLHGLIDLIAASDADPDGVVTQAELLDRDLTTEARYQVGSQHIDNLWDYMSALSRTVGHVDGEGECKT